MRFFLGHTPPDPWVGFPEIRVYITLPRNVTNAFASFYGKGGFYSKITFLKQFQRGRFWEDLRVRLSFLEKEAQDSA